MKIQKIEPIYLNDYWQAYNGINKHYARRARLKQLKGNKAGIEGLPSAMGSTLDYITERGLSITS